MAACTSIYEWSTSGAFGPYSFVGVTENGRFDTPFFTTPNITDSPPAGRVQGEFFLNSRGTAVGNWAFNWFEDDSWLTAITGFGNTPGEVLPNAGTGGSGQWADFIGTLENTIVSEDPFVIEWKFCPQDVAPPLTECATVFEYSTAGNFGDSLFSGVTDTGTFDTPMFDIADVKAPKAALVGAVQGKFGPSGDISVGSWAFSFSETGDNVVASYGFTDSAKGAPEVITGGTGPFSGMVGQLSSTIVSETPDFIIQWDMCPLTPAAPATECTTVWELSTSGDVGSYSFAGSGEEGNFETPFYYSMEAAMDGGEPDGIVAGAFYSRGDANPGNWNLGFFDDGSWISARSGFGSVPTPSVVTGATGRFAGMSGSLNNCVVTTDPFIIRWDVCPTGVEPPPCPEADPCQTVYELSASGDFGDYTFSGLSDKNEFDTPFYSTMEDAKAGGAPIGRVQGEFFSTPAGVSTGQWGFHFFEEEDWLIGRLGFGGGVTPNAATGGSGRWVDFVGTIRNNVVSDEPFVIEWKMCPETPAEFAAGECLVGYEDSTSITVGGKEYTGVVAGDTATTFDTPVYDADPSGSTPATLTTGLLGEFYSVGDGATGNWAFSQYGSPYDHIVAFSGFGTGANGQDGDGSLLPHVITGGSGEVAGFSGTIKSSIVSEEPKFIIEWSMCPEPAAAAKTECEMIYELSTSGEGFGSDGYSFTGASADGIFQTPFYNSMKDAEAAAADPASVDVVGVVQGRFFTHGDGANAGDWSFIWSTEDALAGRLGFGDVGTPNVVLGGTGQWSGFKGTIDNLVVSEDPFIIRFTICPDGVDPPLEAPSASPNSAADTPSASPNSTADAPSAPPTDNSAAFSTTFIGGFFGICILSVMSALLV